MIGGQASSFDEFLLVDIVAHGTACGIMNPYYVVLFGRAIEQQLSVPDRFSVP